MTVAVERVEACPLCGRSDVTRTFKFSDCWGLVEGHFSAGRCAECGLLYLTTRPTPDDIGKCYPDNYGPYAVNGPSAGPGVIASLLLRLSRGFARAIRRRFPDPAAPVMNSDFVEQGDDRILVDFGCGSSAFLDGARARGWRTVGLDFNPSVVGQVRRAGHEGYLVTDPTLMQEYRGRVTRVRMNHVLEHVEDPRATLAQVRELLEPGGLVRIAVPNPDGLSAKVFRSRWLGLEPRHRWLMNTRLLTSILREAGFRNIQVKGETAAKDLVRGLQILVTGSTSLGPPGPVRAVLEELLYPVARLGTACGLPDRLHVAAIK